EGEAEWWLIHVEVQGQEEARFAERMFLYYCRLNDRYNKPVVSVAVLADENPRWRPATFRRSRGNCTVNFAFPVVKLLDFTSRLAQLEASDNPFAAFVLAYLKALETKGDNEARLLQKTTLIK